MLRLGLLLLVVAWMPACGGAPDPASDDNSTNTDGKTDSSRKTATINFGQDLSAKPSVSGSLQAEGKVMVYFNPVRFYKIIDGDKTAGTGYFASKQHCYGYGCCEIRFEEIGVNYRFGSDQPWTGSTLSTDYNTLSGFIVSTAAVSIPQDAQQLELFFDVPGYNLKAYYCACDAACVKQNLDQATFSFYDYQAWDSNFGQNYVFAVGQAD